MSFGTSVGDIILLIQLAHRSFRNCKEAGGEYIEIAREVRNLHSVLKTVRYEAEREDSLIFKAGPEKTKELTEIADGCRGVLEGVDALLIKYKGLAPAPDGGNVGKLNKILQTFRFGTEIEDLGKLRWKIITYTSTLAVLVDSIILKATERVGNTADRITSRMETGFADMQDRLEKFEDMRKAVLFIATRARASQRNQPMESVLSLSTYADDDKEVWRQFRTQLVSLGFKSGSLDRHKEVLKAYMMKLDQTGVLDEAVEQSDTAVQSWCGNALFRTTNLSLLGTAELEVDQLEGQTRKTIPQDKSIESVISPQTSTTNFPMVHEEHRDVTTPSSTSAEPTTIKRRRIPRIKVEQPETSGSTADVQLSRTAPPLTRPGEEEQDQESSSREPETEVDSGIDFSKAPKPRAYAESFSSASEAATSQSTLLREISDSTRQTSAARDARPEKVNRPTSWSGPEIQKPGEYQTRLVQIVGSADSDSTIGKDVAKLRFERGNKSQPRSREKVDDWLKLPSQQRSRASSSPTQRNPTSRSNEELHSRKSNASPRKSSVSSSRKGVKFEEGRHQPRPSKKISKDYIEGQDGPRSHRAGQPNEINNKSTIDPITPGADPLGPRPVEAKQEFRYKRNLRSRSPEVIRNGEEVPSPHFQQVVKAAVTAGAVEAFRSRNEPGGWSGDKATRILMAAIGAGGVESAKESSARQHGKERPPRSDAEKGRPRRHRDRSSPGFDAPPVSKPRASERAAVKRQGDESESEVEASEKSAKKSNLLATVAASFAAAQLLNSKRRMTKRGNEGGTVASESEYDSNPDSDSTVSGMSDSDSQPRQRMSKRKPTSPLP